MVVGWSFGGSVFIEADAMVRGHFLICCSDSYVVNLYHIWWLWLTSLRELWSKDGNTCMDMLPTFHEYYMRHGPRLTCVDHPTNPCMTSNYAPDMLSCYPSFQTQEIEPCTSSVVERSNDDDTWINMLPTVS